MINEIRLSFANIWGLCCDFDGCYWSFLKFNSSNTPLCDTNFEVSIHNSDFPVRVCILLIWKDSVTHMHGLAVYVKERLPFKWELSQENSFNWVCFIWCFSSFFSIDHCLCRCSWISYCFIMHNFLHSTHLLMYLFLVTSTSIIRTC